MSRAIDTMKKALVSKKPAEKLPAASDFLSTGSTLLNLAITGNPMHGFKKGMYYYFVGDTSSGKAQPMESKILTSCGWVAMKDMKVGIKVIDPDGGVGYVTGVFPQGKKEILRVHFSDGSCTECCEDHLWYVQTINHIRRGTAKVATIKELGELSWEDGRLKYMIPICSPVEFEVQQTLPIDPYVLGTLLGNGYFGSSSILSSCESEIVNRVSQRIDDLLLVRHKIHPNDYSIRMQRGSGKWGNKKNTFNEKIKELGLKGCRANAKFIPKEYLLASKADRIELLRGLFDTDGYICEVGSVSYSTASQKLADGIIELVRSLGGIATKSVKKKCFYTYKGEKKKGRPSHTIWIRLPEDIVPFRLKRKADRMQHFNRKKCKFIKKIEAIGVKECQCIAVDTARNLYVTDDYIVTHNTWLTLTCLAEAMNNPAFASHRIIYDNAENGALMDIAKFFGKRVADRMEPPRTVNGKPVFSTTIEDFYFNLDDACKEDDPFIYIMDSMDVLSSEDESKKFEQHKRFARKDRQKQEEAIEKGREPKGSYGDGKAKKNSANIRRVLDRLRETGSILIIISQTRDNIGAAFWESDKTRSGGKALSFYATVEIWTSVKREIVKTVLDKRRQLGIVTTCQVKKNRVTGKHRRVDVNFYHSYGIDDIGTIIDWLIDENRWEANKKKGTPIEDGTIITAKDFSFKGRKEKLIRKIEEEGLENELRQLAGKVWDEIEEECKIERKPRYV